MGACFRSKQVRGGVGVLLFESNFTCFVVYIAGENFSIISGFNHDFPPACFFYHCQSLSLLWLKGKLALNGVYKNTSATKRVNFEIKDYSAR